MARDGAEAIPLDLVVSGGTVVTPEGVYAADVGIAGGRIAALAGPGNLAGAAALDARGLHVFPGVIDPHTHPGNLRPFEQDIAEETRAAAAGGITAIVGTVKCTRMGQPFREVTTAEDVCSYHDVFPLARAALEAGTAGLARAMPAEGRQASSWMVVSFRISNSRWPAGVWMVTTSPTCFPIRPRPMGDEVEIFPLATSDSSLATILYCTSVPRETSWTTTVEPKATQSRRAAQLGLSHSAGIDEIVVEYLQGQDAA